MATIFDCDGTLVDSETLAQEVMVQCAAEHGLQLTVAESLQRFRGGHMAQVVETLEDMLGKRLPGDFVDRFRQRLVRVFEEKLQAVPGARDVLQNATGPLAVASSGPPEKIRLSLELTGLRQYFDENLYSCYEIGVWKPAPDIFLHVAERLQVEPRDCTVVEDSLPGILSGLAAGMRVIAYQPEAIDPQMPSGVIVVRDFREVGALIS